MGSSTFVGADFEMSGSHVMREASSNRTTRPPRDGSAIKTAVATLGLISGIAAGTAPAAVLVEAGDAGDVPGTAQS